MKIICVGRNYAAHARELQNPVPDEPVLFMKPDTALLKGDQDFYLPSFSKQLHYEAEIVVRIDKMGKCIPEKFAHKYYSQISVGLDFTARDLQRKLKEKGLPWEKAKAFDNSAWVGKFVHKDELPAPDDLHFTLLHNQQITQQGHSAQMLFPVHRLIHSISQYFTLKVGDLIYTGTPAGVGSLKCGDLLEVQLEDISLGTVHVK